LLSFNFLQAVVFDCDGVLVDTEPLHYQAFQEVLSPLGLGHSYEHYLDRYIGFDDRDALREAFREANRTPGPGVLEKLMLQKGEALLRLVEKGVKSFPGVVELVRELAGKRIPLAVASGALKHEVVMFVKALGLSDAFSVIVAADDVARSKPDPETYLRAVERLGALSAGLDIAPRSCVAIEDTVTGIASARRAGLVVLGVANSYPVAELQPHADCVVESLNEVGADKLSRLVQTANR